MRYLQGVLTNNKKRKRYLKRWYRHMVAGRQFVYIDESGFAPHAHRTHGWAHKGKCVYGLHSGDKRPRTSLIASLIGKALVAPMLFAGTCNTSVFNTWLETQMCPHLGGNHVVVMDNATFHKSAKTKELIENTGATLLFLPPYSPDLNPIEQTFGTIKRKRQYLQNHSLEEAINMYY